MKKKLLVILFSSLAVLGCEVDSTVVAPNGSRQAAQSSMAVTRTVGTGSGDLTVDGKELGIKPGDVIAITPGRYSSLTFANLTGFPYFPVKLVANDVVEVVGGGMTLDNVSYLTLDGGLAAKNFYLHDIPYRGITISGNVPHSLYLIGIRAKNIADYALIYDNRTNYNGLDLTAFTDFRLLFCSFENVGSIQFRGELNQSAGLVNYGLLKNPEIAYCSFQNSAEVGAMLYVGNGQNMNIHNNWVNSVNYANNNHNGIFFLKGNGNIHHNKCTNHQGNFIRFWPFSQGSQPKDVLIHDNIVWNSRKYSAFELQSFADNLIAGVSTYCNAKVYNNTVGRMNTSLPTEFVGVVVDVYNLFGGDLQIFNNLSFEQVKTAANDGIWSQQSTTKPSVYSSNRYFRTAAEAGLADYNYFRLLATSPAKGTGLYRYYETDDFYGSQRASLPSIGAVE